MNEPTTMAAVLVRKSVICTSCGRPFESVPFASKLCGECVDAENRTAFSAWQHDRTRELEALTEQRMTVAGMSDVEIRAKIEGIPVALKRALPLSLVKAIMAGVPAPSGDDGVRGFGIAGNQGVGKTMCMAAILRSRTFAILAKLIATRTEVPNHDEGGLWMAPAGFLWVNWPDRAAWLKSTSMVNGGAQMVEAFTRQASGAQTLVMDDLGRERLGKNYDEDYAFGILDRIIDTRSRGGLSVLWTSNLTRKGLATRYGAALTSRLLGMAPAVELGGLPDLRLSGGKPTTQPGGGGAG